MQQYMTGEQVARIVTMPGKAWVNYDADYIQGEFDFEVAAGSTEPMNETFRRQSAMQLVDASMPFLEMGVANPQALYMHILQKGFGVKDAGPFIMQQGRPPQMPAHRSRPGAATASRRCRRAQPPGMPPEMVQQGRRRCRPGCQMAGPPPMDAADAPDDAAACRPA